MKKLFFFFFLVFGFLAFSQEQTTTKQVYDVVDDMASFPGGINAFRGVFAKTFNSKLVFGQKGNYKCEVTFVVERDGTISDVKAIGQNMSLNVQAISAVKNVEEKWKPASVNGVAVRSRFRFPVSMNIE